MNSEKKAYYHLPGLFEFYDFYCVFLPLYREHRDWFYPWCEIASVYGSPQDCLWGGGRTENGIADPKDVFSLLREYQISARLTFSNSLLKEEHLSDRRCNELCELFSKTDKTRNGVILHSDLLLSYLKERYPQFYFVSSTTKVLTDFSDFVSELNREEFSYVVPDFRLNKRFSDLSSLSQKQKDKTEFLVNECCYVGCKERKECYESVSHKNLGDEYPEHVCHAPGSEDGYRFSKAMESPAFISVDDIRGKYTDMGFSNFKIEGRGLGSALLLEFILYYMTKPEYQLRLREEIYLENTLDLF